MTRRRPSLPVTEGLHPRAEALDTLPLEQVVLRLHQEDLAAVRAVRPALPELARAAQAAAEALRSGGRLLYVGAGTSGRLGVLDASECPPTFGAAPSQVQAIMAGGRRALTRAVEGAEDDREAAVAALRRVRAGPGDLVCGISASARTPFVLAGLEEARRQGARTALVCCAPPAPGLQVDHLLLAETGPELVAGSTRLKAGTATKLMLNALTTSAFIALGKVYRGRMVGVRPANAKLRARAVRMVAELAALPEQQAHRLLEEAGGEVRLALAMHFTGLGPAQARRRLQAASLRQLAAPAARHPTRRKRPG